MFSVNIRGIKRFNASIKKISLDLNKKFAPELAKEGYNYARRIAPMDTGALIDAIQFVPKKNSAKVVLNQPVHPKDGKTKPYHLWMHGIKAPSQSSGGAGSGYDTSVGRHKPKSGVPRFMYVTYDYMLKEYPKIVDDIFRKAK